jgi:hypothetical protein
MAFPSDMDDEEQADDNGERDAHQGGIRCPNDIAPKRYGVRAPTKENDSHPRTTGDNGMCQRCRRDRRAPIVSHARA